MADNRIRPKGKNPANQESELFKRLTRLFSGPIVNYRSQSGRRIRRQHLDKYSSGLNLHQVNSLKRHYITLLIKLQLMQLLISVVLSVM